MYFDTGFVNKRRLMDIQCLIRKHGELTSSAMLTLHAFSGCDSSSAFIRDGKVTGIKTVLKHPVFVDVFGTFALDTDSDDTHVRACICAFE